MSMLRKYRLSFQLAVMLIFVCGVILFQSQFVLAEDGSNGINGNLEGLVYSGKTIEETGNSIQEDNAVGTSENKNVGIEEQETLPSSEYKEIVGWNTLAEGKTYLTENGRAKGWQLIGDIWYYFDAEGFMLTGRISIDSDEYFLDKDGKMKTGWIYDTDIEKWYYAESSGRLISGWKNINGSWYYMDEAKLMKTGWLYDEHYKSWFYTDNSGAMKTGWHYDDYYKNWYYFNEYGYMVTGWYYDNSYMYWYYMHSSGEMAHLEYVNNYWLNSSGAWTWTFSQHYFTQGDYRWAYKYFGNYNMANTGCVPTTLAMVLTPYYGTVRPDEVADVLYKGGFFNTKFAGSGGGGIKHTAEYYSLKYSALHNSSEIKAALSRNSSVLAAISGGNKLCRNSGITHEIMLHGISGNMTYVYDTISPYNNGWYDIDWLFSIRSMDKIDNDLGYVFHELCK